VKYGIMSLLACMTLAATPGRAEPVKLLPGPFELPDRIGPMRYDGQAHKYDDARLGWSYQYLGGGLSLTVYVYDLGARDIPDGGDTRIACEAFEGAKGDVLHAGYQDMVVKSEQLARLDPAAERPTAREAVFEYTRADRPTVSYLWVTGAAKQFVKLRFSVDTKYRDELVEARRAILTALGDAIKPHLGPADPEAGKSKASMAVNGSGDPDELGTAIIYLASLDAGSDENPDLIPVCGGEFVPDYAHELGAFQSVAAMADAGKRTKFTRRLGEIASAGFLDEFVWTYRHRETWGLQPPDGLELEAFDKWRAKKLKRFTVPDFGSVNYDTPRPLPLEPAVATSP
jgi:hypothetical protein